MCVLLDMYEERGEARGIEKGIAQGEARGIEKGIAQGEARGMAKGFRKGFYKEFHRGIEEINALYQCLLADNRMEDIQKSNHGYRLPKRIVTGVWDWRVRGGNSHRTKTFFIFPCQIFLFRHIMEKKK